MYMITCVTCFKIFFARSHHRDWPMLAIFLILFAKATSSLAIQLSSTLRLATSDRHTAATSMWTGDSLNLSKYATILVEAIIGSGFLIYRCWLVYSRSWVVVAIPIALWLGGVVFMGIVINVITTHKINGLFSISQSRNFGAVFWALVICVNLITSALIARRVWRREAFKSRPSLQKHSDSTAALPTTKQSSACLISSQSFHAQSTRIIVDSGLIYTTMSLLTFGLFVADSVAVYPTIDMLIEAIGITFNLIVIYNRPRVEEPPSFEARMNNTPLQYVSSTISGPGSAIEFAYPKNFTPRRKRPASTAAPQEDKGDINMVGVTTEPSEHEIPQTQSHESL
ncbi:hypothetical protein FB45DRAFT_70013 [Roridomyces roridus]|uniref:Uncharacterized protein n=1 Tax=Roridomyces roridus TaxID=1738132 RepID=A0AAD7FI40_9AGAR|nr:hypothetical protein FB45DRAFT_70013 [Roridomyces roridus]